MGHSQGIKDRYSIVGKAKKSPQQIAQKINELREEYKKAEHLLIFSNNNVKIKSLLESQKNRAAELEEHYLRSGLVVQMSMIL